MSLLTTEIVPNIFRIRIAPSEHFEFNHFLILGDKTCLIHTGKQSYFETLHAEVSRLLQKRTLDHIVFSHFEADECGSINSWLQSQPNCTVVCNKIANISLGDAIRQPAQVIRDGEKLPLGNTDKCFVLQMIETPHFPHNWDAHLWFEETNGILFSSDFCIQGGVCPAITNQDVSKNIISYYEAGNFMPYGTTTNTAVDRLSRLPIKIIAPMHGSTIIGDVVSQVIHAIQNDLFQKSA